MKKIFFKVIICFLIVGAAWALPALAQSTDGDSGFGGPSSVGGTIDKDREAKPAIPVMTELVEKYFGFKKKVEEAYGFSFGFDYNALIQFASESPGEDTAAGGVFRVFGSWTLPGRDTGNTGTFVYKIEDRHRLGTDIAPKDLGFETGYAGLTAVTFSNIGWALTNLYWGQHFLGNRLGFVAGVVDVTDYTDVFGLVSVWTDFNNDAFTTNPTIPAPDQGLGAAVRVMAANNIYVIGGIADANGHPTEPEKMFDSFFNDGEYFTHLEVGWASSWEKRFDDNIHITAWHVDEREEANVSSGWGMAFSFCRLFADTWEPFFRAGYAKDGGALWEGSISAGLGYHTRKNGDMLGLGLNWSRPAEDTFGRGLNDQYTAEVYYRVQVLKVLAVTPDVQVLIDPALNPDEDVITIWGLRGRLSF